MKVVIFCGGQGTRLREITDMRPKPMVEIGGRPVLWHIMKTYSHYGYNDFILCLGYMGNYIKEYFLNYHHMSSDFTINTGNGCITHHKNHDEDQWNITLADTGLYTSKGGRLLRISDYIEDDEFMLTYGDGVADVNIRDLVKKHNSHDKLVTFTGVQPRSRWATVTENENGEITSWAEKNKINSYINGGFFVINKKALDYITDESMEFEEEPMEQIAKQGQAVMYRHHGLWECMDTYREYTYLNNLWDSGKASWAVWE